MKALKKILESELLTDEMKEELKNSVEAMKAEMNESAKKELEVQYAEKLVEHKNTLSEKLSAMISEAVDSQVTELKEDITYYKGIEAKYAKELVEFKDEYKTKFNESMVALVEGTVKEEVKELEEDLMEAKKTTLGRRVFEALEADLKEFGLGGDVKEVTDKLEKSESDLKQSQEEVAELQRDKVLETVLKPLKGSKREVMQTILEGVDMDKIEERYSETIESVLNEKSDNSNGGGNPAGDQVNEGTLSDSEKDRIRSLFGKK